MESNRTIPEHQCESQSQEGEIIEEDILPFDNKQKYYDIIKYTNVEEVNYLEDFLHKTPECDYKELDLPTMERGYRNSSKGCYDTISCRIEKKIVRDGYFEKPEKIAKKLKRNNAGEGNFYNLADDFIDDTEQYAEKKQIEV